MRDVALAAFYFARLHHWQATRRLEVLRETDTLIGTLEYVGFMWATRTIKDLPDKEPLAIVRPARTIPKVNLRWEPRRAAPATTKVRVAVLPLILPGEHLPERLRKLPLTAAAKQPRLPRTDIEIESTPLCRTLPVYRYLKPLRRTKRTLAIKRPKKAP